MRDEPRGRQDSHKDTDVAFHLDEPPKGVTVAETGCGPGPLGPRPSPAQAACSSTLPHPPRSSTRVGHPHPITSPWVRGNSPQPAQLNPHGPEPLKVPWVFSIMRIIQKEDWDLPGIQGKVKDERKKKKKPGRTHPQILTVRPLGCGSPSNFYLLCPKASVLFACLCVLL